MESFDDVEENIRKDDKEVEKGDHLEYDHRQAINKIIKTKYEDGKGRHFYKAKTSTEESGSSIDSSTSTSEEAVNDNISLKNESLTSIELRRLEEINGRASRLVFKGIWELPDQPDIMALNSDILCIVEAKRKAPSCFCVFEDIKRKIEAEKQLDGRPFRHGVIMVDPNLRMVPVDTHDLDSTRELRTLAVHGFGRSVTTNDLEEAFPGVKEVKIAHRGGSAFLKYQDDRSCSKAFLRAEVTRVGGYRVQVLFGHFIDKNQSKGFFISSHVGKRSIASQWLPQRELSSISRELSLQSVKTPSKVDIKSLLLVLDEAGLQMDKLQSDYIKGGCEPGSGPDIRTAWMDHLKTNAKNKLSRASRLDLVDNVWNFFDDDEDTQQRLKIEKKHMENEKTTSSRKRSSTLNTSIEKTSKYQKREDDMEMDRIYKERRTTCTPERKRSWENSYSPQRKTNRKIDYSYSSDKNGLRYRDRSYSQERKSHESWEHERSNSRLRPIRDSSWYRNDFRMSSSRDDKHKNKYDNSSSSQPPTASNSLKREFTGKALSKTSQFDTSSKQESIHRINSETEDNVSVNKRCLEDDEIFKQEKKLKKGRALALESDIRQSRKHSKAKMIIAKTAMMKKLKDKSQDSKLGNKVLKKYKKVLQMGKKKQRDDLKRKEETAQSLITTTEYIPLANHFNTELELSGLKTNASLTTDKIIDCFVQEGLTFTDLEQMYLRHFCGSPHSEKLLEGLATFLTEAGFSSSRGIGPKLAAGITIEYFHSSADTQIKLTKCKESGLLEKKRSQPHHDQESLRDAEESKQIECETKLGVSHGNSTPDSPPGHGNGKSIPAHVLQMSEGFPRMALVMAGRLVDTCEMDQEECKAMASAMVEIWVNYGFSYNELKDMYIVEKERDPDSGSDDVSLLGMRKLLHSRLREKATEEGHEIPRKFGFSVLIDITMFYFEKTI